jgi:hypothetical protein
MSPSAKQTNLILRHLHLWDIILKSKPLTPLYLTVRKKYSNCDLQDISISTKKQSLETLMKD